MKVRVVATRTTAKADNPAVTMSCTCNHYVVQMEEFADVRPAAPQMPSSRPRITCKAPKEGTTFPCVSHARPRTARRSATKGWEHEAEKIIRPRAPARRMPAPTLGPGVLRIAAASPSSAMASRASAEASSRATDTAKASRANARWPAARGQRSSRWATRCCYTGAASGLAAPVLT